VGQPLSGGFVRGRQSNGYCRAEENTPIPSTAPKRIHSYSERSPFLFPHPRSSSGSWRNFPRQFPVNAIRRSLVALEPPDPSTQALERPPWSAFAKLSPRGTEKVTMPIPLSQFAPFKGRPDMPIPQRVPSGRMSLANRSCGPQTKPVKCLKLISGGPKGRPRSAALCRGPASPSNLSLGRHSTKKVGDRHLPLSPLFHHCGG